jgi:hypothetical protein
VISMSFFIRLIALVTCESTAELDRRSVGAAAAVEALSSSTARRALPFMFIGRFLCR